MGGGFQPDENFLWTVLDINTGVKIFGQATKKIMRIVATCDQLLGTDFYWARAL